ncbi:MAG TPA: glyoxylate/hydroxypyruvate reductase A [Caulobacteraceae bacterium]|nr:glyoxylate/hydroxypyruvate reductase A [Caulobacteraceae bacterium]
MKTLLVAADSESEFWAEKIRAAMPGRDVLTSAPGGEAPVAYAVVDHPLAGLLRRLAGLEVVLSLNAGVEHLLAGDEVPDGVPIVRMADDGMREGMIEWVTAHVLAWHRHLFAYRAAQMERRWVQAPEALARERTVTVLGAGALGAPVAAMLAALGFETRAWSRARRDIAGVKTFAGPSEFGAALQGADILVSLLPSTAETENLLDGAAFAQLSRGAFVVNAGRGRQLADADLIAALDAGHLGGAALDVFREEPLPADHPFWTHPAILVSPHVAAPTQPRTAVAALVETIRRHEHGEPLLHVVDRRLGY